MAGKQGLKQGEKVLFGIFGAFVVAAIIGYIVLEVIRHNLDKPMYKVSSFELSEEGHKGSVLFRERRCTSCHRAMRNGTNMGLSLDGVGSKRSLEWLLEFLRNPESTYSSATIDHGLTPKEAAYVADLPPSDLKSIAIFLSELKAEQGAASSPLPPEGKSGFIDGALKMVAPQEWKEKYKDVRDSEEAPSESESLQQ